MTGGIVARALAAVAVACTAAVFLWAPAAAGPEGPSLGSPRTPIEHFVVLMQENHTFDNYFGTYPNADGIPEGTCMPLNPFDPSAEECVSPYHIEGASEDLDHSSATFELQFNEGRMDGFVHALERRNQNGSLAMGYYDDRDLPFHWNVADDYVLFDRFFSSAHGGSLDNHMFWMAGAPAPGEGHGIPRTGFLGVPTIFDRLEDAGISWKFYIQNYDPAITYRAPPGSADADRISQLLWAPILAMPRFVNNPDLNSRIVDLDEYFEDLSNGTLPAVSYLIPSGASEHPPGSLKAGQRFIATVVQSLMQSSAWESSAFMYTYDDWGGWFDHVRPPQVDEFGYGFRVPTLLISPYARRGYVDSTVLDFSSVPRFIQENWGLAPLAERDANANAFMDAFDFEGGPRRPVFVSQARGEPEALPSPGRAVIYVSYTGALVTGAAGLLVALTRWGRRRAV